MTKPQIYSLEMTKVCNIVDNFISTIFEKCENIDIIRMCKKSDQGNILFSFLKKNNLFFTPILKDNDYSKSFISLKGQSLFNTFYIEFLPSVIVIKIKRSRTTCVCINITYEEVSNLFIVTIKSSYDQKLFSEFFLQYIQS